jgi:predicted transcriptional regulator YheO
MSATMTYDQLSASEQARIEAMVKSQLASMDATNRQIVQRTRESLAFYVANAIQATAAFLGYVIALPLAYAEMIAERFVSGFKEGWNAAFDEVRRTRKT